MPTFKRFVYLASLLCIAALALGCGPEAEPQGEPPSLSTRVDTLPPCDPVMGCPEGGEGDPPPPVPASNYEVTLVVLNESSVPVQLRSTVYVAALTQHDRIDETGPGQAITSGRVAMATEGERVQVRATTYPMETIADMEISMQRRPLDCTIRLAPAFGTVIPGVVCRER
jgi:hypothetical protein